MGITNTLKPAGIGLVRTFFLEINDKQRISVFYFKEFIIIQRGKFTVYNIKTVKYIIYDL